MMIGTNEELIEYLKTARKRLYKVKAFSRSRSIPQNSYLHLIFGFIEEFWKTGHDKDELKEILKSKFLRTYSYILSTTYIKPTKSLDNREMTIFIGKIRVWAREFLKLDIPDPEEKRMLEYYNNKI